LTNSSLLFLTKWKKSFWKIKRLRNTSNLNANRRVKRRETVEQDRKTKHNDRKRGTIRKMTRRKTQIKLKIWERGNRERGSMR
jgi:hypothetical protein